MSQPIVSIIVPVYNVEKYLDRCLNSLVNQTLKDIEIVLVDDGSPDNSPFMCDEWAKKDSRIRVIHKKNGGLSSARNAGLKVARGKYVGFVDSDDWILPDMYEYLANLLNNNSNADFAAIQMLITKKYLTSVEQPKEKIEFLNQDQLFKVFFRVSTYNIHYCVCDKLFRRELLKDVSFWEGMRFEDIDYNFKFLRKSNNGIYSNQIKYFYFYNENGITRNSLVKSDLQLITIWKNIKNICEQNLPDWYYYADMNYQRAYMGILGKSLKFGVNPEYKDWEKNKKQIIKHLRRHYLNLITWHMPISRKILLSSLCVIPGLTFNIFDLKNKR